MTDGLFGRLLESSPDAMIVVGPDGEVRHIHSVAEVTPKEAGEPIRDLGDDVAATGA